MDCKTIAPMIVAGRSADGSGWDARNLAYEAVEGCETHSMDSGWRRGIRFHKRQAHKAERRSERGIIAEALIEMENDPLDTGKVAYEYDPEGTEAFFEMLDYEESYDTYYSILEDISFCRSDDEAEMAEFCKELRWSVANIPDLKPWEVDAILDFLKKYEPKEKLLTLEEFLAS